MRRRAWCLSELPRVRGCGLKAFSPHSRWRRKRDEVEERRGGGTRGRAGGWCSIMGNENQGPPQGSELKWLSHAAGVVLFLRKTSARGRGGRGGEGMKGTHPLAVACHPLTTLLLLPRYFFVTLFSLSRRLACLSLFLICFCSYRALLSFIFKTTCPSFDRYRYSIARGSSYQRWIERLYPGPVSYYEIPELSRYAAKIQEEQLGDEEMIY